MSADRTSLACKITIGLVVTVCAYFLFVACASEPTTSEKVVHAAANQASGGWFDRFVEVLVDRGVEILLVLGVAAGTAVVVGVNVVHGIYIGAAALGTSYAFRPAQNITHNIGGSGPNNFNGGGGGMGFLEYVGLGALIFLGIKYLVIPRPARNFWGGLWGMIAKRGERGVSFRKFVSSSGLVHTSKETANVAKGKARAVAVNR